MVKLSYSIDFNLTLKEIILSETLRLYSPVDKLIRTCVKDYKVQDSDFVIEKGTNIFIPVYSIHHDSRFYYDPMVFDPERFSPEQKRKRSNMTFLSFGNITQQS